MSDITTLADWLNLSDYQRKILSENSDKYDLGRLEKRGGVLYAPRRADGFLRGAARLIRGAHADLIGRDRILLRARRNVKFCAGGFHRVRIGRFSYYANAAGHVVSRDAFFAATGKRR